MIDHKIKAHLIQPWEEREFYPLLLFRGGLTIGRAKALYNMICAAMEMDLPNCSAISKATTKAELYISSTTLGWQNFTSPVAHASGLHAAKTPVSSFYSFIGRLRSQPGVMERTPNLREYITDLVNDEPHPWCIPQLIPITPIAEWKTRRLWRKASRIQRRPIPRKRQDDSPVILPAMYPYLTRSLSDDEQLLAQVDMIVSTSIPESLRADICQDLIVGVLERKVDLTQAITVAAYIKDNFRRFPIRYGPLSLDTTSSWDDAMEEEDIVVADRLLLDLRDQQISDDPIEALMQEIWS